MRNFWRMNGSKNQGDAALLLVSEPNANTAWAMATLTEIERIAAERRAVAEGVLAEARDFEEHLTNERRAITALASAADAAGAAETEAITLVRNAREKREAIVAMRANDVRRSDELGRAEEAAKAAVAAAQERLELAHHALETANEARSKQQLALDDASGLEAAAQAEIDAALRLLEERRAARTRADADVVEMRARMELLSGTNGLSPQAVQRVVERRVADMQRQDAKHGRK
jgi:hypothetical protein